MEKEKKIGIIDAREILKLTTINIDGSLLEK